MANLCDFDFKVKEVFNIGNNHAKSVNSLNMFIEI